MNSFHHAQEILLTIQQHVLAALLVPASRPDVLHAIQRELVATLRTSLELHSAEVSCASTDAGAQNPPLTPAEHAEASEQSCIPAPVMEASETAANADNDSVISATADVPVEVATHPLDVLQVAVLANVCERAAMLAAVSSGASSSPADSPCADAVQASDACSTPI